MILLAIGAASLGALALEIKLGKFTDVAFGSSIVCYGSPVFGVASLLFFLLSRFKESAKRKG